MKAWLGCVALLLVFPVLASAGLIVNGGFETGDFTGWTQSGDTGFTGVATSTVHSGTYSAYFGSTGSYGFITQTIATTPGAWYETTFWLQNDGGTSSFEYLWDGTPLITINDGLAFGYTEHILQAQAAGATTTVSFGFYQPPSYWHFDDVDVNPGEGRVPEPASLALIGLGLSALALVRRKRA